MLERKTCSRSPPKRKKEKKNKWPGTSQHWITPSLSGFLHFNNTKEEENQSQREQEEIETKINNVFPLIMKVRICIPGGQLRWKIIIEMTTRNTTPNEFDYKSVNSLTIRWYGWESSTYPGLLFIFHLHSSSHTNQHRKKNGRKIKTKRSPKGKVNVIRLLEYKISESWEPDESC